MKEITDLKLKIDIEKSRIEAVKSVGTHLQLEVDEKKELLVIYEAKNKTLVEELSQVTKELHDIKREMVTFKHREHEQKQKIEILSTELAEIKVKYESLVIVQGNLEIRHVQVTSSLEQSTIDYHETIDKLHIMNKARHDLETKLVDEIERNRSL